MRAADFLLGTLSHFVKLEASPPPGVPVHAGDDFEKELALLCQAQRLAPIVLDSFDKLSLTPRLSRITLERLRVMAQTDARHSERMLKLGKTIGSSFADANIPCLFIGELVAAQHLYPAPRLRPIDAIELLVREDDWKGILALLEEQGFASPPGAGILSRPGQALDYYQFVAPCVLRDNQHNEISLRFRMHSYGPPDEIEAAWLRESEARQDGEEIALPSFEDRLIRSVLDWNYTGMTNLLMLVDIGLLLTRRKEKIDWRYTGGKLNEMGFYTAFYLTLEYALGLLKIPSIRKLPVRPGALRRKIFKTIWYPGMDAYATTGKGRNPLKHFLFENGKADRKLTLLKRLIAPPEIWISAFFNRPVSHWLKFKFVILLLAGATRRRGYAAGLRSSTE